MAVREGRGGEIDKWMHRRAFQAGRQAGRQAAGSPVPATDTTTMNNKQAQGVADDPGVQDAGGDRQDEGASKWARRGVLCTYMGRLAVLMVML